MSDQRSTLFDVFVSYAHEDRHEVREFVRNLRAHGLEVWIDEEQMHSGLDPQQGVLDGLRQARHMLLWLTDTWLTRQWTHWELKLATEDSRGQRRVIPVLHRPWDTQVMGPYLTDKLAIDVNIDEYARVWLAACGVRGQPPGPRESWSERGRNPSAQEERSVDHDQGVSGLLPELPLLRPLTATEGGCELFDASLVDLILDIVGRGQRRNCNAWISLPSAMGKSLAIRSLTRSKTNLVACTVQSLDDLPSPTLDFPLVVELDGGPSAEDIDILRSLEHLVPTVVVLSSFPLPRELPMASDYERAWEVYEPELSESWRQRLVAWVYKRLPADTKLDPSVVARWLAKHDPRGVILSTPGDMVTFLADIDRHGNEGSFAARAHRWIESCAPSLPESHEVGERLEPLGKLFRKMTAAALQRRDAPFDSLGDREWTVLLHGLAPAATGGEVVRVLKHEGLLRTEPSGVVPHPRWVAHALAVDSVRQKILGKDGKDWGLLAADGSRRAMVDYALDVTTSAELLTLVDHIAAESPPASLASVATLEATLAAVARRLALGKLEVQDTDVERIHTLLRRQLDLLVEFPSEQRVHYPYSRRDNAEWFATGWACSLFLPPLDELEHENHPWQFPGWVERLSLAEVPRHFPSSFVQPFQASLGVQRLILLSSRVVSKIEDYALNDPVPRLLLPAMFLDESFHERLSLDRLLALGGTWEERVLAAALAGQPRDARRKLANLVWQLCSKGGDERSATVAGRIETMRWRIPVLTGALLNAIDNNVLEETARAHHIHVQSVQDPRELLFLARSQRHAALRGWGARESHSTTYIEARELVPLFDADDLDLAVELTQTAARGASCELAPIVWRTSPERALTEAGIALRRRAPATIGWFYAAPREHLLALLDVLEATGVRSNRLADWAHKRVLEGGEASERLFNLARSPRDAEGFD